MTLDPRRTDSRIGGTAIAHQRHLDEHRADDDGPCEHRGARGEDPHDEDCDQGYPWPERVADLEAELAYVRQERDAARKALEKLAAIARQGIDAPEANERVRATLAGWYREVMRAAVGVGLSAGRAR